MKIKYSTAAKRDTLNILREGTNLFGPAQANRYLDQLQERVALLERYPESARLRVELKRPVRVLPIGSHLILYEVEAQIVRLLRIIPARSDIERAL